METKLHKILNKQQIGHKKCENAENEYLHGGNIDEQMNLTLLHYSPLQETSAIRWQVLLHREEQQFVENYKPSFFFFC